MATFSSKSMASGHLSNSLLIISHQSKSVFALPLQDTLPEVQDYVTDRLKNDKVCPTSVPFTTRLQNTTNTFPLYKIVKILLNKAKIFFFEKFIRISPASKCYTAFFRVPRMCPGQMYLCLVM